LRSEAIALCGIAEFTVLDQCTRSGAAAASFLCGGASGAGVPCPVHPKSQMHLNATAKPSTDGTAPIQRQRVTPFTSTRKSNHDGSNQNQSAKNEAPTASEATVASHDVPGVVPRDAPGCPFVISNSVAPQGEPMTKLPSRFILGLR